MPVGELIVDKDWVRAVLVLQTLLHAIYFVDWNFQSRPPVPLKAGRFAEATEAGDKATRRHGECVAAIVGPLDSDGQSVG